MDWWWLLICILPSFPGLLEHLTAIPKRKPKTVAQLLIRQSKSNLDSSSERKLSWSSYSVTCGVQTLWAFLSCVPRKSSCDFGELFLVTLRLLRGSLKALNKCDFLVILPNLFCIIMSRRKTENDLEHKSLHSKTMYGIIIREGSELI